MDRAEDDGAPDDGAPGSRTSLPPFEAVVRRHGPTVLRVCSAVVGPERAEDAWSETFLAALRAYPDLPAGTNLEAWLVTVAHRKAIDVVRAEARRPVPLHPLPDVGGGREPGGPERDLWDALATLTDRQRRAVAYHHLAGLSFAEVAALLGGTEAAARKASSDGVRALRRALGVSAAASPASLPASPPTSGAIG